MIRCLKCDRDTQEDTGRCQYCNEELPKGIFSRILVRLFRKRLLKARFESQAKLQADKELLQRREEDINDVLPKCRFLMVVLDVFFIEGRGIVVVGKIRKGIIRIEDNVTLISGNKGMHACQVKGIEKFRERVQESWEGQSVGLFLSGINRNDIERGDLLTK
jgi:translation elongation factor EF-Tu-like GTPase